MVSHSRARHARTHVPGYALDKGMQRARLNAPVPRYGKRGVYGHCGAREHALVSIVRAVGRTLRGAYPMGVHGA